LAEKHPYSPGGAGAITATVTQFRNALPTQISAETLKKLGIAPNNETYIINLLRFLGVIDAGGNKTPAASSAFTKDDDEFQKELGAMIEEAYAELFKLHQEKAWDLPESRLISFFRTTDQTSAITGKRQALTFQTLASLAGHGNALDAPKLKSTRPAKKAAPKGTDTKLSTSKILEVPAKIGEGTGSRRERDFGLTVRIEVNLPQAADQETYDRIFRSIRDNLLNGR